MRKMEYYQKMENIPFPDILQKMEVCQDMEHSVQNPTQNHVGTQETEVRQNMEIVPFPDILQKMEVCQDMEHTHGMEYLPHNFM